MHLHLSTRGRSGDLVLRTYHLQVGYHDEGKPLFDCPDLLLQRQECAAIIGPNGAGKTTFLKTILEKIPPYSGKVQMGASLELGYFAQAHEGLDPEKSLMQEIGSVAPKLLPAEIRNYLAKFLFTGNAVFRKVGTLSGGERGRLALAKLSLTDANLLLLDEPTNHLDLPSQEVLDSVLSHFPGTILLVSHDRYLIDSLASQIWEVDPHGKSLVVFKGSYTQYKAYQLKILEREEEPQFLRSENESLGKEPKQEPAGKKSPSKYEVKILREKQSKIELTLQDLEEQLSMVASQLENPPTQSEAVLELGEQYVALQAQIDDLTAEWDKIERQLGE
jgi:ATP-binding cassette subfamily F protein 3